MDFYKTILILAGLSLIFVLAIFGVILGNMSKKQVYPANVSKCPDYYSLVSGSCVSSGEVYSNRDLVCQRFNFDQDMFNSTKTGSNSGLCAKKQWAIRCGVSWDGITNNTNICY